MVATLAYGGGCSLLSGCSGATTLLACLIARLYDMASKISNNYTKKKKIDALKLKIFNSIEPKSDLVKWNFEINFFEPNARFKHL
jgi:hypothetical protein